MSITIRLKAGSVGRARLEVSKRWPKQDVTIRGYDASGFCVYVSTVRKRGDRSTSGTATMSGKKAITFYAKVEDTNV